MATKDIVLVGGGHAHVHVMKALAGRLPASWRVTLVSPGSHTPYSGMLPGFIAGIYSLDDAHIDLEWLATETGAHFRQTRAVGLDREKRLVLTAEGEPVPYDLVSLDVGITPALDAIPGAAEHAIAVKPIAAFVAKYDALMQAARRADGPRRIAVVGGGAGGVELLLSLHGRLARLAKEAGLNADHFGFVLVTSGALLATHNARVRQAFRRDLAGKGIILHEEARVTAIEADGLRLGEGAFVAADAVLVTTQAQPPDWFAATGLALDEKGVHRRGADAADPERRPNLCRRRLRRAGRDAAREGRRLCGARRPAARPQPDRHGGRKGTAALVPAEAPSRADFDRREIRRRFARGLQGRGCLGVASEGLERPALDGPLPQTAPVTRPGWTCAPD